MATLAQEAVGALTGTLRGRAIAPGDAELR